MNRRRREARRQRAEELQETRLGWAEAERDTKATRARKARKALAVPRGPLATVDQALDGWPRRTTGLLLSKVRHIDRPKPDDETDQFPTLLRAVGLTSPRLIEPVYVAALFWVSQLAWVRPLSEWMPRGKGRDSHFQSLCEHLLASFPMPPFIWGVFFAEDPKDLVLAVGEIAAGKSLYKIVREGMLPIPLTRKMCHALLTTPKAISFVRGVRRAQTFAVDGDERLLDSWMDTLAGRSVHHPLREEFWFTVLHWFAQNPMLDPTQVAPLVDYIDFRRGEDAEFSIVGRSALAMLRGLLEWHGDLAKEKAITGKTFPPSGFEGGVYPRHKRRHGKVELRWFHIREILGSQDLAAEGRALKHCIYSYAWRLEKGDTSIWTMLLREGEYGTPERVMTIEVQNAQRCIVQARGKTNKYATSEQGKVLIRWANDNQLQLRTRWS